MVLLLLLLLLVVVVVVVVMVLLLLWSCCGVVHRCIYALMHLLVAHGIVNRCSLNSYMCFISQGRSAMPEIDNTSFGMAGRCIDAPLASTRFKRCFIDFSLTSNGAKTTFEHL